MDRLAAPAATEPDEFRRLMACWATGVSVVTSTADGAPVGCTVNALTSVSLAPPLLLVALAAPSRTLGAIRAYGRFGVNVLSSRRPELAARFAGGDPTERFAGVPFQWAEGVPILDEIVAGAVCFVERCVDLADHVLVVAGPTWWRYRRDRRPLISFRRGFWSLPATDLSARQIDLRPHPTDVPRSRP